MVVLPTLLVALQLTSSLAFSTGARFGTSTRSRDALSSLQMSKFMTHYEEIQLDTNHGMSVYDITPQIEDIVAKSGCKEGTVTVLSKHYSDLD